MAKQNELYEPGIGKVVVDLDEGTLRPSTMVVGMRLGVGHTPSDTSALNRQKRLRKEFQTAADKTYGRPQYGWIWLENSGSYWSEETV